MNKFNNNILLSIYRKYDKDEAVAYLKSIISPLQIELGEKNSEIEELKDKNKAINIQINELQQKNKALRIENSELKQLSLQEII